MELRQLLRNFGRFYPFIKPYRFRAVMALVIAVPVGIFNSVIAALLKPYVDFVQSNAPGDWQMFFPLLIIAITVTQSAFNYLSNYLNVWVGKKVANDVKMTLFDKLMANDPALFDKSTSGEFLLRYNTDADVAAEGTLNNATKFIKQLVLSVGLVAVMLWNSWILAVLSVAFLLVAVIPLSRVRKRMKQIIAASVRTGADINTDYNEAFSGNRVVTAYNLRDFQRNRLKNTLDEVFRLAIKMVQRSGLLSFFMHLATGLGMAATIWLQGYLIMTNRMTIGNFASFITALIMFYEPIKNLSSNFGNIQVGIMAMERVLDRLELKPSIVDRPGAKKLEKVGKSVRYVDVGFSYQPGRPVLSGINLDIGIGRSVAFVGHSGGGKTTLVTLLPRFYDVDSGYIAIDGVDIRDISLESLRDNIAIVFQDNFLFGGTIRENIMLGRKGATDAEVDAAVRAACLDEFIASLPDGLDTEIGERGILLSGGQKQRVAIARAFIKDAPIVILDEATSALDTKSEVVVQRAIENLMENKTVLIIAHRLSTVINADRIVVVEDGRIVEAGTHEELIAAEGTYASLYRTTLH